MKGNKNERQNHRSCRCNNSWCSSWRNVRLGVLIMMSRHDAYYEPNDSGDNSDEIDELTWQLMKAGAEYDPNDASRVAEALSELDVDTAKALQDCIDTEDYEKIGRKIMMITFDYMERFAKDQAEREIND